MPAFRPADVLATLQRHRVRYVLIGGLAATLHGSPVDPSGTSGYSDLVQNAMTIEVDGVSIPVASLEDVIRSKTAANRPKDRAALPVLLEVLRQSKAR